MEPLGGLSQIILPVIFTVTPQRERHLFQWGSISLNNYEDYKIHLSDLHKLKKCLPEAL